MSLSPSWHPVAAAGVLRAGENAIATLLYDQPLALWRSAGGSVQAWEDRCPHRGVPLSLGRIDGDRLACAYHGWQYAARDGRCVAIPAMPHQPVPGKVCVKTYPAQEAEGLVWVQWPHGRDDETPPGLQSRPQSQGGHFLRALSIERPMAQVEAALAHAGFARQAPHTWRGAMNGTPVQLFAQAASAQWCVLHMLAVQTPDDAQRRSIFGAMHALRASLEAPAGD